MALTCMSTAASAEPSLSCALQRRRSASDAMVLVVCKALRGGWAWRGEGVPPTWPSCSPIVARAAANERCCVDVGANASRVTVSAIISTRDDEMRGAEARDTDAGASSFSTNETSELAFALKARCALAEEELLAAAAGVAMKSSMLVWWTRTASEACALSTRAFAAMSKSAGTARRLSSCSAAEAFSASNPRSASARDRDASSYARSRSETHASRISAKRDAARGNRTASASRASLLTAEMRSPRSSAALADEPTAALSIPRSPSFGARAYAVSSEHGSRGRWSHASGVASCGERRGERIRKERQPHE
eukprot:4816440-Pleurochrysis_carterae.AAC.2